MCVCVCVCGVDVLIMQKQRICPLSNDCKSMIEELPRHLAHETDWYFSRHSIVIMWDQIIQLVFSIATNHHTTSHTVFLEYLYLQLNLTRFVNPHSDKNGWQ